MRPYKPLTGEAYLIICDEDLVHHDDLMKKDNQMKDSWRMGEVKVVFGLQ